MNILTAMRDYIGELERRRRFYRTERLVRGLPPEVLKDIGWPGSAEGLDQDRPHRLH
jgi:hypothetical protein